MRWLKQIGWVVFCMALIGTTIPVEAAPRNAEPYTENHAYIPYGWCSGTLSEETIEQRLTQLEGFGIRYLLCDIGCYTPAANGTVRNTIAYQNLGRWIEGAHRHKMTVLACINYVMRNSEVTKQGTNASIHQYVHDDILRISKIFTQTGVDCNGKLVTADGVQMDVEPFRKEYQASFLQLMKDVRTTVGKTKRMGIATPAKNGIWSDAYATQIIELFDFVFPMVYDSNGPESWGDLSDGVTRTQEEYIQLTVNTCVWYADLIAKSQNRKCILSITTPAYADCKDESGVYYHKNYDAERGETLEKMENCLLGIRRAVASGVKVDGAGVFYWPAFIGELAAYSPARNLHYDFELDQAAWNTLWLTMRSPAATTTKRTTTKSNTKSTTKRPTTKFPTKSTKLTTKSPTKSAVKSTRPATTSAKKKTTAKPPVTTPAVPSSVSAATVGSSTAVPTAQTTASAPRAVSTQPVTTTPTKAESVAATPPDGGSTRWWQWATALGAAVAAGTALLVSIGKKRRK